MSTRQQIPSSKRGIYLFSKWDHPSPYCYYINSGGLCFTYYVLAVVDGYILSYAELCFRYDISLDTNTVGPCRLMGLAKRCKKLRLFLHISTGIRHYQTTDKPSASFLCMLIIGMFTSYSLCEWAKARPYCGEGSVRKAGMKFMFDKGVCKV